MKSIVKYLVSVFLLSSLTGCGAGLEVFAVGAALTAGAGTVGIASAVQAQNGQSGSGAGLNQSISGVVTSEWRLSFEAKKGERDVLFHLDAPPAEDYFWKSALRTQQYHEVRGDKECTLFVAEYPNVLKEEFEARLTGLAENIPPGATGVTLAVVTVPWQESPTQPGFMDFWGQTASATKYTLSIKDLKEGKGITMHNPFTEAWQHVYVALRFDGQTNMWPYWPDEQKILRVDVVRAQPLL